MATTQADQRKALEEQLRAEAAAALAKYQQEAERAASAQKLAAQSNIDSINNQYNTYSEQTNADMAKSIDMMLRNYSNDATRRGMARSTYALDRNTEGESAIRQEISRALTSAAANRDATINQYQGTMTNVDSDLAKLLAAYKVQTEQGVNSALSRFDLGFLQQQQELENQKSLLQYQNSLKGSGGGGSGYSVNPYAAPLQTPTATISAMETTLAQQAKKKQNVQKGLVKDNRLQM